MSDREKVIGHLNDCMEASRRDNTWVFVRKDIIEDALALLKEQEWVPVTERLPKSMIRPINTCKSKSPLGKNGVLIIGECPVCGQKWLNNRDNRFCGVCGTQVEWEDVKADGRD